MANPFTTQQIQERYQALPADIKAALDSQDIAHLLEKIGRKHKLRIDSIGILIEYSSLIMLGLIKTDEFVSHLSKELSISREKAEEIAVEVDQEVFARLRGSLRQAQYQSTSDRRFEPGDDDQVRYGEQAGRVNKEAGVDSVNEESAELPPELDRHISTQDYNSEAFGSGVVPEPTLAQASSQAPERVAPTGLEHLGAPQSAPTSGQADMGPSPDQALAQETISKMPRAMQEAHAQKQAGEGTPAPEAAPEQIQDFRTRLEQKISQQDKSTTNNDPYRESID